MSKIQTLPCHSLFPKSALSAMFSGLRIHKATNLEDKILFVKNVIPMKGKDAVLLDNPSAIPPQEVILFFLLSH